jgi:large subunit ribosomal protein L9
VAAVGGPAVDRRKVEIGQPIKSTGEYVVHVRLHPEVQAKVAVHVVGS